MAREKPVVSHGDTRFEQRVYVHGEQVKRLWTGRIFQREPVPHNPIEPLRVCVPMSRKGDCWDEHIQVVWSPFE
jgi:hypothetical protein